MPPIFEICNDSIDPIESTTFSAQGIDERKDLQRLLRDRVDVIAPDVLVIAEEFGEWTDSRRRIDLLGIDEDANLVVIELKCTEDGGHMELQAVRYAAMVSTLTAARAVEIFARYLEGRGREEDAQQLLLEHLNWGELDEDQFGQDVRLVLVASDFSRELTTAVMWLNEKDLDIRCVRIKPYQDQGRTLIDVQQLIPLPEAGDYQVQVREKRRKERRSRESNRDLTRYDITIDGQLHPAQWKRNGILLVIKSLFEKGVKPQEMSDLFREHRMGKAFFSIDAEVQEPEKFKELADRKTRAQGKKFSERRWHGKKDDLMVSDGRTYLFTNQWGNHWLKCMQALSDAYPEIGLEFSETGVDAE